MRLFQVLGLGSVYLQYFAEKCQGSARADFGARKSAFLAQGYSSAHILAPVASRDPDADFTVGDDAVLQRLWRLDGSRPKGDGIVEAVLNQIEAHRADVVYVAASRPFDSAFARRMPRCVRHTVAWHAAPNAGEDFSAFSLRVSNFEPLLVEWKRLGLKAERFDPAIDDQMKSFSQNAHRDVDVAFVGSVSRHHVRRNLMLAEIAQRFGDRACFHLSLANWARVAQFAARAGIPVGRFMPGADVTRVGRPPLYGVDMYRLFGRAKVVLNASIDMSAQYRGNMRCFEAMGCGALMVSDRGKYPQGWVPGQHFLDYADPEEGIRQIEWALQNPSEAQAIADSGSVFMRERYSSARQWLRFQELVSQL